MTRQTKADLLDRIGDLEESVAFAREELEIAREDCRDLIATEKRKYDDLVENLEDMLKGKVEDRYPDIAEAVRDVIAGATPYLSIDHSAVATVVIPPGVSRVRWVGYAGGFEFEYAELGVRYWAAPWTGKVKYSDVA